jgi:metallo-beta-lactamase family protein
MDVRVKFLGAAQSVTGSKYLLEIDSKKILVDCGLFQGQKDLRLRNWDRLPVNPETIDLVVITHAHIDHTGYLPRLVKDGFHGKIICTHATKDLMEIMLRDAAKLQEEEALYAFKIGYSKHSRPQPLFTLEDAEQVFSLVKSISFSEEISLFPNITLVYHYAGHILGAAMAELNLQGNNQNKKIVFSGDIGRFEDLIMYPPALLTKADILFVESTYGDKLNPIDQVENDLVKIINEAYDRNGVIIIPAFAVGRTQMLIYYFHQLMKKELVPSMPIFVDSPMAITVTDLYERHHKDHKIHVEKRGTRLFSIFDDPNIHYCQSAESSKALNDAKQSCIIISASGMATGGRILHHLYHRLPKENDTVLFVGYQAEGSRGRKILEGDPFIKIFGEEVPVKCQVKVVNGLSAHADQQELIKWLENFADSPKMTFVTHGEVSSSKKLAEIISKKGWQVTIPEYLESFQIFREI